MATEVSSAPLPQLQSVQKAMSIPSVEAAVGQVGALYTRVKGAHSLLEWALSTAEASVTLAASTAAPFVAAPLAAGDARMVAALDALEKKVPIVTEQPKVIVETTKQAVLSRITPQLNKVYGARAAAGQRVQSLKELTWAKANTLLSTAYGQKALSSVDSGALDPTLHTVQTVGRLSAVAARRVWANLANKVNELRSSGIELDVRRYITALMAALHLAKVTSDQHQNEQAPQQTKQKSAEPTLQKSPPTNVKKETPSTTEVVKTSPEAKSNGQQ
ncbi:unnamed protein product [Leptidea sinapis]|uniref:Lipid storage droplets surface-binding protein 2 n=1 Tax=Leptidea sinapis TaxID=189913 RepID=A0A5E4Q9A2_9NEOP|nr:unnamed protein product [Leptidea sinapis]